MLAGEDESGVWVINLFRSFLWQIGLKSPQQDRGFYLIRNIFRMALRFDFGFQMMQYKLNKGLFPDRHKNHDVLGKYSLSFLRALPGRGDNCLEHPDPTHQAQLSFPKVI